MSESCPFCERIERGEYDDVRWFSDDVDDVVAFEPLNPVTPGHMLVVPRIHCPHAAAFPALAGRVMEAAANLAFETGPCNIITSCGVEATQTVFHMHFHVIPRHKGDGLHLPWTGQKEATDA
jgi:histidine triad (HIT) family protein